MALFKCNTCHQEYEDYYPPDDTCLKCKQGFIRIVVKLSTSIVDNSAVTVDM
jgi:hypothetical protein